MPFYSTDETAHLGYAHVVSDGSLPEITTEPHVPAEALQWRAERASGMDERYRSVWVANHPPLPYVVVVPLMWWSTEVGRSDGGLLLLRLANVGSAAVGVGLTYLLGKAVSGGDRRVGVVAAGLAALLPYGHATFSQGMTDGMAFVAVTAVAWAGVVCLQRGVNRRHAALLAGATLVAAGARAMTMVVAVAVVAVVACVQLTKRSDPPWARLRRAGTVAMVGLLPAAAMWGWFYMRNVRLYGDLAASEFLLDRFDRTPRGGWLEVLTWGHLWTDLHRALLWRNPPIDSVSAPLVANVLMSAAIVGLLIAAVTRRSQWRPIDAPAGRVDRSSLLLLVIVYGVVVLMTAQHISGGGSRYARYLLPAVGVLASLVALGICRLSSKLLPTLSLGLLSIRALGQLPTSVDPTRMRRPRDGGPMPMLLQELPSTPLARHAAVALIVAGFLGVGVALARNLWSVRLWRAVSRCRFGADWLALMPAAADRPAGRSRHPGSVVDQLEPAPHAGRPGRQSLAVELHPRVPSSERADDAV